ncbi:7164_t:CDS:1, partial [Racocetra fulgida]
GFDEACEFWNAKVSEFKKMNEGDQKTIKSPYLIDPGEPPPANMVFTQSGIGVERDKYEMRIQLADMNHGDEISISQDEIFDEICCGSCYRNDTDLEVGRKKVDTKDIDEDKEDCRTLVGNDEVFE